MKNDGMDYLAQQMQKRRKSGPGRLLRVLDASRSTPFPPNVEVLQGVGGTAVYRVKFGGFRNDQSSR